MYTENLARDLVLAAKAVLSNQVARFAPSLYVRLTAQTGRGKADTDPAAVADYYRQCFADYGSQLGLAESARHRFFAGKRVLEYGPGDVLGVALLCYAYGAAQVDCVDRFPLQRISPTNVAIYRRLLDSLPGNIRARAARAFRDPDDPAKGFDPGAINYRVTRDGLVGTTSRYDLVLSRAVLEHVNRLDRTFTDIARALVPDGISIHLVDLKSHGLDRYRAFDFLTWPEWLYRLMYSAKGFPNRWRADSYVRYATEAGLEVVRITPTGCLVEADLAPIRPHLAEALRATPSDQLGWLGFWLILRRRQKGPG